MSVPELLRWQWQGYPQYHRSRFNLLLHVVVVPVFLLGNVTVVWALAQLSWRLAVLGVVTTVVSIALQGVGHRREPTPPEPFSSPLQAVARILGEQWVTFPRFVLSGGWARAWRRAEAP